MVKRAVLKRFLQLKLRTYFFTGLLVVAPLALTIIVVQWAVTRLDAFLTNLLPAAYHPDRLFGFHIPGLGLLAAGCAQQASRPAQGEDSPLQRWLDAELAPYLAEQLGRHPRFKGEPVMLVSLDGPDIQPDIDGLTRSLRDQLMDRLLSEPGVRLPWQPQQRQEQHHRRLERANCARIRDADYYIGIEITRSAADRYRAEQITAEDVQIEQVELTHIDPIYGNRTPLDIIETVEQFQDRVIGWRSIEYPGIEQGAF